MASASFLVFCDMIRQGLKNYGIKYTKIKKIIDITCFISYNVMRYIVGKYTSFKIELIALFVFLQRGMV